MDLMTPEGGTIVWTAVTFVILVFVLYKVGWKPILHGLEARELRIRESLEAAESVKNEVEKTAAERQKLIEAARNEAQEIVLAARQAADVVRQEIIKTAHAEAEKFIDRARHEIDVSRGNVLQEMRNLAVELSMAATQKLIGKNVSKGDHDVLIQQAIQKMDELN